MDSQTPKPLLLKILLLGDNSAKATFFTKFTDDGFNINVDYTERKIHLDGQVIEIQAWVMNRQERFEAPTSAYFSGTSGVLLIYDSSDEDSLEFSMRDEIRKVELYDGLETLIVEVNMDPKKKKQVTTEKALEFAKEHDMQLIETSLLEELNIEEIFGMLAKKILTNKRHFANKVQLNCKIPQEKSTCY
ncbi:ras-related protein Rab-13-like [Hydractinia symbiolongicarpus]|uniref:ras-related protein Rab-13-like n=1 Tax=Hydractinia symbiolongicarpus TaxID=13093 RepID=UPI00254D42D6|nr:ras-related protein Rab-13-like [Hydractinia symbiolongicarpus]